jgi:hypothetical protein
MLSSDVRNDMLSDLNKLRDGIVKSAQMESDALTARLNDVRARREAVFKNFDDLASGVVQLVDTFKISMVDSLHHWRNEIDKAHAEDIAEIEGQIAALGLTKAE